MAGSTAGDSSHGGSFNGSAAGSSLIQVASAAREDAEAGSGLSFWADCFNTLYTINKGRRHTSVPYIIFKYLMEFAQLLFLMMGAQYGWRWHTASKAWQFVEFIQVRPFMALIEHHLYAVVLIIFLVLLVGCSAVWVWVFHSVTNNRLDLEWPLRLARPFGAVAFEALDLMALSLLLTALDCRYYGGWLPAQRMLNHEFPTMHCLEMPNVAYAVVSGLAALLFLTMAAFSKLAQMDLDPVTRALDAYAHPSVELWVFGIKMLMVLCSVFLGEYRHLAIVWLLCAMAMAHLFWKWEPMVVPIINYVRMGTFAATLYASCMFMALQFPPTDVVAAKRHLGVNAHAYEAYVDAVEFALAVGVLPAFLLGSLASYFRLRYFRVTVAGRFRSAPPGTRTRDIHQFSSPREVELVARCCRVWNKHDTLRPEAVALAERVLKTGLACLPDSPFMIILYTSYLVDVQGSFQSGYLQLQVALKLNPSFIDKYAIFSREQDHVERSASAGGQNEGVSDVEFHKSFRLAVRAHKEACQALRAFWQLLAHAKVRFEDLTAATRKIDNAIKVADKTYRMLLQRNADKPRLLRLYAKYLERVKHDPWAAARWNKEADKLDQVEGENRHTNMLGLDEDGGDIGNGRISLFSVGDNGQERALCVFTSQGVMSMTNDAMRDMFGYSRTEMKGKSVAALLPPVFAEQLMQQVKSFVLSSHGAVVLRTSDVVALHADRHMFAGRVTVVRISGIGEDSTFLASLEAVPPKADTATVWLLASGQVLSVDAHFRDWSGHNPADLEGGYSSAWTPTAKQLDEVLKVARHAMVVASQAAVSAAQAKEAAEEDLVGGDPTMHLMRSQVSATTLTRATQMDGIAQALASAAQAPLAALATGRTTGPVSEWTLKNARMLHKFAEPFNVDISVTNTCSSAFRMHILSVRRSQAMVALAIRPIPHMFVASPGGAIVHVTEALAVLLGTTAKELMANGSYTALASLMVQPFGTMHRAGLAAAMPPQAPPSYSCRSGLSILMPVHGCPTPEALPFRMQMKKRVNLDETFHVCTVEPTTWEQALDERSLRVTVDDQGVVTSVGASPTALFGFSPSTLVGHNVACCISALREAGVPAHTSMRPSQLTPAAVILLELSARSEASPGSTWRVGVGWAQIEAPVEDNDVAAVLSAASMQKYPTVVPVALRTKLVSAVMTVTQILDREVARAEKATAKEEEEDDGGDASGGREMSTSQQALDFASHATAVRVVGFELRLWRADMVTSILEVDATGLVIEADTYLNKLYPAGAALGTGANDMLGRHIGDFLPLGDRRFEELFDEGAFPPVPFKGATGVDASKRRSNIKASRPSPESGRVGPQLLLHGRHRLDGLEIDLSVQIVRKGNGGAYLVVHLVNPKAGRLDLQSGVMERDRVYTVNIPGSSTQARSATVDGARTAQQEKGPPGRSKSGPIRASEGGERTLLHHTSMVARKPSILCRDSRDGTSARMPPNIAARFSVSSEGDGIDGGGGAVPSVGTVAHRSLSNGNDTAYRAASASQLEELDPALQHVYSPPGQAGGGADALGRRVASATQLQVSSASTHPRSLEQDSGSGALRGGLIELPGERAANSAIRVMSRSSSGVTASVSEWVMSDGRTSPFSAHIPQSSAAISDEDDSSSEREDISTERVSYKELQDGQEEEEAEEEAVAPLMAALVKAAAGGGNGGGSGRDIKEIGGGGSMDDAESHGGDDDADYRQGQRFKKLGRLMGSDAVTSKAQRCKWHTLGVLALITIASIALYVLCHNLMLTQIHTVEALYLMGIGARKSMRVATSVLDLGMLYQPSPNTYLSSTLAGMQNTGSNLVSRKLVMSTALALVKSSTLGSFAGFNISERMPVAFGLRALWETPTLVEHSFVYVPSTELNTNSVTSLTPNATYILKNYTQLVSLFEGSNTMATHALQILSYSDWYNSTAPTEFPRASHWIDWTICLYVRYNMASTYLSAWMQTLDGYAQVVIAAAATLNLIQIAVLLLQGGVLSGAAALYMCYLGSRVDRTRHIMFNVFMTVPSAMVRTLATQRIIVDDADGSDDEADEGTPLIKGGNAKSNDFVHADGADTGGNGNGVSGAKGARFAAMAGGGGSGVSISFVGEAVGQAAGSNALASAKFEPPHSFWARVASALAFWRTSKVAPSEKRTISRSLRGVVWLMWPFILWGAVIIIINAVGYAKLKRVDGPIMTFNTVNFVQLRSWSLCYAIQALQFDNTPLESAVTLRKLLTELQLEYQAMLFGSAGVPAETSLHFASINEGIASVAGPGQKILFASDGVCLAQAFSGCLPPTDIYYQYTMNGLDNLVRHTFEVVKTIIDILASGTMVTNSGPELQYMWKVRESFIGGTSLLTPAYKVHVEAVYLSTLTLQLVALIWTLAFVVLYLAFILRPYLNEVSAEARRVTELLTQLPLEIDVEGLVSRALLLNGKSGRPRPAGHPSAPPPMCGVTVSNPSAEGLASPNSSSRCLLSPTQARGKGGGSLGQRHPSALNLRAGSAVAEQSINSGTEGGAPFLRDSIGSQGVSKFASKVVP